MVRRRGVAALRSVLVPRLVGASLRDRAVACLGALIGIGLTGAVTAWALGDAATVPVLVAPMGATAVLVFAVPASPLAQPWPVVGGNTISALVGVLAVRTIGEPNLAAGAAVAGAILVMSLLRCLHPPGGAAALTAVIGGAAVHAAGYRFALVPVAFNSALLLAVAWLFHRWSGHSYPHRPAIGPHASELLHREDIDAALAETGETFDITSADLDQLLRSAERHAVARRARAQRVR